MGRNWSPKYWFKCSNCGARVKRATIPRCHKCWRLGVGFGYMKKEEEKTKMKLSKVQQKLVDKMRRNDFRLTWDLSVWKFLDENNKKYSVSVNGFRTTTVNRLVMDGVLKGTKPNGSLRLVDEVKLNKLLAA